MKSVASVAVSFGMYLLLAVSASVGAAEAAKPTPKAAPDLAKGQATAAICVSCHTQDGSRGSPTYPNLQGQHPEYLAKQLAEYKSGKRVNAIMTGIASALSEDDMRNVSALYAGKSTKAGFAKNAATVALGEKIFRGGIADRLVPACAGCHGPNGAGIPAQYPRLGGQHADYTEAQLVAFRGGLRKNSVPMTGISAKMNDREIKAVADYIAGLY